MSGTTYYQKHGETMLDRGKEYYENDKEILREQSRNKYRELSEEKNIYKERIRKK